MSRPQGADRGREIEAFLGEPTYDPAAWRELWQRDTPFPVSSHRGIVGRLIVAFKRLLRPLVRAPIADLWERQRVFNLVLLGHVDRLEGLQADLKDAHTEIAGLQRGLHQVRDDLVRDLEEVRTDLLRDVQNHHRRLSHVEGFNYEGFEDVMRHADALYAVVDQKLDRYRRESRELSARLGALLAAQGDGSAAAKSLDEAWSDGSYLDLEDRFRGSGELISERLEVYLPYLEGRGEVLDLGCGRGEALALLGSRGISAKGVDSNTQMVRRCREAGLRAEEGDLFETLAGEEGSLGGIVSFHVIEHLPAPALERLVRLAWRALAPGGVLILETPNPLSLVMSARDFWIDPTHRRPVHPAALELLYELAGFDPVERLEMRPFADDERLPEIELSGLEGEARLVADRVNQLRDRIDGLLFGCQDFAIVGTRPGRGGT